MCVCLYDCFFSLCPSFFLSFADWLWVHGFSSLFGHLGYLLVCFFPGKGLGLGFSLSGGRPLGLDRRVVAEAAADYFCRKNAGFRKVDPLRIEVWRHRSCCKNVAILHVTVKKHMVFAIFQKCMNYPGNMIKVP